MRASCSASPHRRLRVPPVGQHVTRTTDDVPGVQVRAAGAGAGLLPADLLPPRGRGSDLGGLASDGRSLHPLPDVPHSTQGSHVRTNTRNRYDAPLMIG